MLTVNFIENGIPDLLLGERCPLLFVGDSISNQNTNGVADDEQSNIVHGLFRTWTGPFSGACCPSAAGHGLGIQTYAANGIGTTLRDPNETFDGSVTQFAPMRRHDLSFGATLADATNIFRTYAVPGTAPYTNPAAPVLANEVCTVEFICLRHAAGAALVKIDGRRCLSDGSGSANTATSSAVSLNGADALVSVSLSLPVHATRAYPDFRLQMAGGGNAANQSAHVAVARAYRDVPGLEICAMAVGGAGTSNWLDPADPDAAGVSGAQALIKDIYLINLFALMGFKAVIIFLGANDTTLGADRYEKLIERLYAASVAAGNPDLQFILWPRYACAATPLADSDASFDMLSRFARVGTSGHGTLGGVDYAPVGPGNISVWNLREAMARPGYSIVDVTAQGVLQEGSHSPGAGTGTFLFDKVHPTCLLADAISTQFEYAVRNPRATRHAREERSHRAMRSSMIGL